MTKKRVLWKRLGDLSAIPVFRRDSSGIRLVIVQNIERTPIRTSTDHDRVSIPK